MTFKSEESVDNKLTENMDEKIKTAVRMFTENISELEKLFKTHGYNNAPYPSDNDIFTAAITENSDLDSVNIFFDAVYDGQYSSYIMDGLSPERTIDLCKDEIKIIKKKRKSYHHYYGFANVAMSVCMGLVAYHFLSDKTEMTREFNRDKWEAQGEYCSSRKVTYTVSAANKGGKAHYNNHEHFDG